VAIRHFEGRRPVPQAAQDRAVVDGFSERWESTLESYATALEHLGRYLELIKWQSRPQLQVRPRRPCKHAGQTGTPPRCPVAFPGLDADLRQ
jgi:hypothetical protein